MLESTSESENFFFADLFILAVTHGNSMAEFEKNYAQAVYQLSAAIPGEYQLF